MKKINKLLNISLAFAIIAACVFIPSTTIQGEDTDKITLASEKTNLWYNGEEQEKQTELTATLSQDITSYTDVKWEVSNYVDLYGAQFDNFKKLVSIDLKGLTSTLSLKDGAKAGTITVNFSLKDQNNKIITSSIEVKVQGYVTNIKLEKNEVTIFTNPKDSSYSKTVLKATVEPSDAYKTTLGWESSKVGIIKVEYDTDNSAVVKALKAGSDDAMVASFGGKRSIIQTSVKVNVVELVEKVTLDKEKVSLSEGDGETLKAAVENESASDKTITWSSSDEEVVQVDQNGNIKALKEGTAIITARANVKYDPNGTISSDDAKATCTVTVEKSDDTPSKKDDDQDDKKDSGDKDKSEDDSGSDNETVTCEDANGKGWIWSETKKACVYIVTNTSTK